MFWSIFLPILVSLAVAEVAWLLLKWSVRRARAARLKAEENRKHANNPFTIYMHALANPDKHTDAQIRTAQQNWRDYEQRRKDAICHPMYSVHNRPRS